jgi:hypothetical protein
MKMRVKKGVIKWWEYWARILVICLSPILALIAGVVMFFVGLYQIISICWSNWNYLSWRDDAYTSAHWIEK